MNTPDLDRLCQKPHVIEIAHILGNALAVVPVDDLFEMLNAVDLTHHERKKRRDAFDNTLSVLEELGIIHTASLPLPRQSPISEPFFCSMRQPQMRFDLWLNKLDTTAEALGWYKENLGLHEEEDEEDQEALVWLHEQDFVRHEDPEPNTVVAIADDLTGGYIEEQSVPIEEMPVGVVIPLIRRDVVAALRQYVHNRDGNSACRPPKILESNDETTVWTRAQLSAYAWRGLAAVYRQFRRTSPRALWLRVGHSYVIADLGGRTVGMHFAPNPSVMSHLTADAAVVIENFFNSQGTSCPQEYAMAARYGQRMPNSRPAIPKPRDIRIY